MMHRRWVSRTCGIFRGGGILFFGEVFLRAVSFKLVLTRWTPVVTLTCMLGVLGACQDSPPPAQPQPLQVTAGTVGTRPPAAQPAVPANSVKTPKQLKAQDEENLHSIAGLILEFYSTYDRMPPSLAVLKLIKDPNDPLDLSSPISGQPYGYSPAGMSRPDLLLKVYVWDPQPLPDGCRECLVSTQAPRTALQLDVQEVGEGDFQVFSPGVTSAIGGSAYADPLLPPVVPDPNDTAPLTPEQLQRLRAAMHGDSVPQPVQTPGQGNGDTQPLTPDQLQELRAAMHQQAAPDQAGDAQANPDSAAQQDPGAVEPTPDNTSPPPPDFLLTPDN
jgi:hypothetical protein